MNLYRSSFTRFVTCFTLIFSACFLPSCSDNKATAQQNPASASKSKAVPKVNIHAAAVSGNIEAVQQHIAAGTDINQKDAMGGSSPLITACLYEQKEIARLLIGAGADINFKNNDGSTALHVAAFFCKPEMVKLLLEKGADKTVINKYGSTAYETVAAPFGTVKPIYGQMKQLLEPMGVKLDLAYIEKTRPAIANMLK
jgi:uncharacterized protein